MVASVGPEAAPGSAWSPGHCAGAETGTGRSGSGPAGVRWGLGRCRLSPGGRGAGPGPEDRGRIGAGTGIAVGESNHSGTGAGLEHGAAAPTTGSWGCAQWVSMERRAVVAVPSGRHWIRLRAARAGPGTTKPRRSRSAARATARPLADTAGTAAPPAPGPCPRHPRALGWFWVLFVHLCSG